MPVWMRLVIELESMISVCEVLLHLLFDFSVGFDPIKKLGAVARSLFFSICWKNLLVLKILF